MTATDGWDHYDDLEEDDEDWHPEWEDDLPDEDLIQMIERENRGAVDRNGVPLERGNKVKIVGRSTDSKDVYFAREMIQYLNNDRIYTVRSVSKLSDKRYAIHLEKTNGITLDWSWAGANILRVDVEDVKIEPEIFEYDPKHLDI